MEYRIFPCGESAVTFDLGDRLDMSNNQAILSMREKIIRTPFPGFIEAVTAYNSITLMYDLASLRPSMLVADSPFTFMSEYLTELYHSVANNILFNGTSHRVPVCYDPLLGVDLLALAASKNLDPDELIQLHHSTPYRIYMIGFLPGFPYMGALDNRLFAERKNKPIQVSAGSVAVAGWQTGIYPFSSPGGWHVIGRTPVRLFHPQHYPPVQWNAGDTVTFFPISLHDFLSYQHP